MIRNYYSYYEEMETENPDLGLVFYWVKPDFPSEVAWFSSLYRDILSGDAICLVAEEDGHVVGVCDVHSKRPASDMAHVGILGIAIVKEYRNRGIGRALLETMLEKSKGIFEIITLDVLTVNEKAYELYKKVGFIEAGRHPNTIKRKGRYYSEINMYIEL